MADNSKQQEAQEDRKRFDAIFPGLVNDLVREDEDNEEIGDAMKRLRRVSLVGFRSTE